MFVESNITPFVVQAESAEQLAAARDLFEAYANSFSYKLCFQSFADEVATLPGLYAPPKGGLWIAFNNGVAIGCIALRPLTEDHAELKRLYVHSKARGAGAGKTLVKTAIHAAARIGYKTIRLDTLPHEMGAAVRLYQSVGFVEISPYMKNPVEGALCMELNLTTMKTNLA